MKRKKVKGEIIAIGDELLRGVVQDTNTFFVLKGLTGNGFDVQYTSIIPDNEIAISECLRNALKRSDFVIITGGLGPTVDDRTTETVARTFGLPLKRDPVSWALLRDYAREHGFIMDDIMARMAKLPEGALRLDTKLPRAGFLLKKDAVPFYFLPGIPEETRYLFSNIVLKSLSQIFPERISAGHRLIKIFGLRESEIQKRLKGIMDEYPEVPISFLPHFPENHLYITVRGDEVEEINRKLHKIEYRVAEILGEHIIGYDDDTLEGTVGNLLRQEKSTLAVAESCTGGLIGHRITNVPGSSDYFRCGLVVYSNEAKIGQLGVRKEILLKHGAVSEEVAKAMAEGARKVSNATYGLACTGIAGPGGGTSQKPVGTVFIGIATWEKTVVKHYFFHGNRMDIKILTSTVALNTLRKMILGLEI